MKFDIHCWAHSYQLKLLEQLVTHHGIKALFVTSLEFDTSCPCWCAYLHFVVATTIEFSLAAPPHSHVREDVEA